MPVRYNVNLFNGNFIAEDSTLTPSDGSVAGSSEVISGVGDDADVVVTVRNPNAVSVQMYWAPDTPSEPYEWDELGGPSTLTQQTPMRLRKGFVYRFGASDGPGIEAYLNIGPASIEYDENTDQGLRT